MGNCAFPSILFPVDFSESSVATASHVRGLAEQTGATITLLHVMPWLSAWYSETEIRPVLGTSEDLRRLEEEGAVALEAFRKKYFSDVCVRCEVQSGAVAERITETAVNLGADLIMMPTRGLGRSRPFLIGSTTAKVLHDALRAVWTSPHLGNIQPFAGYKNILCTVDRNDIPPSYLEQAAQVASCFGSKLTFVTAISGNTGSETAISNTPGLTGCYAITEVGCVGDVVRKTAEANQVDLVLTNRGHLQHPFGKFRTHIYEIVLESPCPVLSLSI